MGAVWRTLLYGMTGWLKFIVDAAAGKGSGVWTALDLVLHRRPRPGCRGALCTLARVSLLFPSSRQHQDSRDLRCRCTLACHSLAVLNVTSSETPGRSILPRQLTDVPPENVTRCPLVRCAVATNWLGQEYGRASNSSLKSCLSMWSRRPSLPAQASFLGAQCSQAVLDRLRRDRHSRNHPHSVPAGPDRTPAVQDLTDPVS